MNLLIDIGNTSSKMAKSEGQRILEEVKQTFLTAEFVKIYLSTGRDVRYALIADSGKIPSFLLTLLDDLQIEVKIFNSNLNLPFKNTYQSPQTLGKDRLAAVAGAQALYPDHNCLIIDTGTAITYEYLIDNSYLGGAISPGLQTRFKALSDQTDKLPHLSPFESFTFPGKSTHDSILSGVIQGIQYELQGYINNFCSEYPQGIIIMSGGDANFFAGKINSHIFVHQNLVMIGLNNLLNINQ